MNTYLHLFAYIYTQQISDGCDLYERGAASAGNYELVMIHDSATGETVDFILHNGALYILSVNPVDDNTFASACDDGNVCIWDIRKEPSRETIVLAGFTTAFHAVICNPFESRLIATSNTKEGIALRDVCKPRFTTIQLIVAPISERNECQIQQKTEL